MDDIWFVGDEFVKNNLGALHELRALAYQKGNPLPYIFQFYNIHGFYTLSAVRGITRMINPLIEGINEQPRLPKYIVMVPDVDILMALRSQNIAAALVMGSTLHYLIRQLDTILEWRKQSLREKKPGALPKDSDLYPKIIWIRIPKCPMIQGTQLIPNAFHLRGKFNSVLEECLHDGKDDVHKIMSIDVPHTSFDSLDKLSSLGQSEFWIKVNKALKRFELNKIKLRPRKAQPPAAQIQERRKLPSPHPDRRGNHAKRSRSRSKSRSRSSAVRCRIDRFDGDRRSDRYSDNCHRSSRHRWTLNDFLNVIMLDYNFL